MTPASSQTYNIKQHFLSAQQCPDKRKQKQQQRINQFRLEGKTGLQLYEAQAQNLLGQEDQIKRSGSGSICVPITTIREESVLNTQILTKKIFQVTIQAVQCKANVCKRNAFTQH